MIDPKEARKMDREVWKPPAAKPAQQKIMDITKKIVELEKARNSLIHVVNAKESMPKKFHDMSKDEKIQEAYKMEPLTRAHLDMMHEAGFMTGTMIYGAGAKTPTDIDWVVNVPPHVFSGHAVGVEEDDGYWETDGMSTLYATHRGKLYNIICVSDIEMFKSWYMTTQYMTALENIHVKTSRFNNEEVNVLKDAITNKYNRVRIFRALKDVLYPVDKWMDVEHLPKKEALKHYKCRVCRQEAINFTCKPERLKYEATGTCERCSTDNCTK